MKTFSLSIPQPCYAGWDHMQSLPDGRYCQSCSKTVIDFSAWPDEAVQQHFIQHGQQPVCGRFKTSQLERIRIRVPGYFFEKRLPGWKKFLVVFLLCFGSNFWGIDVLLEGTQPLYAQTRSGGSTLTKTNKQLRAKKKKGQFSSRRYRFIPRKLDCASIKWETMALGYTVNVPLTTPAFNPEAFFSGAEPADSTATFAKNTAISSHRATNPPAPADGQQQPAPYKEYLLPAVLRLRRRARRTT